MVTFSLKEIDEAIVLAVSLTSRRVYRVLSTPYALFSRDLNIYKTTEYGFVVRTMFVRDGGSSLARFSLAKPLESQEP